MKSMAIITLTVSFGIQFLLSLLTYGVGIIHLALLDVYKRDDASTSVVGSLFINLMSITGPLASYFINRWSCRVTSALGGILLVFGLGASFFAESFWILVVTNGIIAGIGIGLALLPCPVAIGYAFPEHSGIAMGITTSGVGVGMLVSGPITQHLLNTYGLRGTFLLSAGIASHVVPCALLLRNSKVKQRKAMQRRNIHKHFKTYISLLNSPSYMCVLIGAVLWNISYAIIMIHLPSYVVYAGSSREQASFMFTVIGIGTTVSRLTIGFSIGPEGLDPLLLNFGLTAFVGTLIITFPLYITYSWGPLIFASLYGIYSGGLLVFTVPLCLEMAGTDRLTSAVGLWFFLLGLGSLTGPPLAGLVLDLTGSYKYSYFLSGLFVLLASGFSLLASIWRKSKDVKSLSSEFSLSPIIKKADNFEKVDLDDEVLSPKEYDVKLLSNNE